MDSPGMTLRGIYRDILMTRDQRTIYDSGWVNNTIVDRFRILLAGFVKNESPVGLRYLAVGQGQQAWDTNGAPAPTVDTAALEAPYDPPLPVEQLEVVYLGSANEVALEPTSRLQITATLEANYPLPVENNVSPLREFGLFARFGDEDYMLNCVRHPLIPKDASTSLVRIIRLHF